MELYKIAIRAIFAYSFLVAILRLSGKKTVAQGSVFDFVLALILGDMIDDALWAEVPISQFIIGTGTLVLVHLLSTLARSRSEWFDRRIDGRPTLFMKEGEILPAALRKEQMHRKEIEEMLRISGLEPEEWDRVKIATIEQNGRPSIILHDWAEPPRKADRLRLGRET